RRHRGRRHAPRPEPHRAGPHRRIPDLPASRGARRGNAVLPRTSPAAAPRRERADGRRRDQVDLHSCLISREVGMDTTAFYAASSGLCFTLLGFWWVVVQFRHAELTADRETRRFIFLVSLHFIVPGVVSLASLLATGPMWRIAFGLAGITGVIAAIAGTWASAAHPVLADVRRWAWLGIPIYALVTGIALVPDA